MPKGWRRVRARSRRPRSLGQSTGRCGDGPRVSVRSTRRWPRRSGRCPRAPSSTAFLAAERPDAVIVTPLIGLPPRQNVIVRSAQAAGIPVGLAVHSWDNLTNKGRIHAVPDLVLVWNEAQVAEARELHGIGPGGVVATGAHSYDHWFERGPRSSRAEFCARVGLDAASPIVLYVGSSMSIAPDETGFVARWLRAVRAHPATRDVGVIIRPHPGHREQWQRRCAGRGPADDDLARRRTTGRQAGAGRLLRQHPPQQRDRRHQHQRADRGRDPAQAGAHRAGPGVRDESVRNAALRPSHRRRRIRSADRRALAPRARAACSPIRSRTEPTPSGSTGS